MTNKEILIQLFKEAKSKRIVLNQSEFAKRIGFSRIHLFKNMKEIPDDVIEKARELLKPKAVVVEGDFNQMVGQRIATTAAIEAIMRTLRADHLELKSLVTKRPYAEVELEFDRIAEAELKHILRKMRNEQE